MWHLVWLWCFETGFTLIKILLWRVEEIAGRTEMKYILDIGVVLINSNRDLRAYLTLLKKNGRMAYWSSYSQICHFYVPLISCNLIISNLVGPNEMQISYHPNKPGDVPEIADR